MHNITLISPAESWKGKIAVEGDEKNFDLVLDYPLKFKKGGISGFVDFGLRVEAR